MGPVAEYGLRRRITRRDAQASGRQREKAGEQGFKSPRARQKLPPIVIVAELSRKKSDIFPYNFQHIQTPYTAHTQTENPRTKPFSKSNRAGGWELNPTNQPTWNSCTSFKLDLARAKRKGQREYLKKALAKDFMKRLNSFFESKVEIPRIKVGKRQELETLINEEALLLAKYLRKEKDKWIPRISICSN